MFMADNVRLFAATKALVLNNGKVLLLKESVNYKDGTQAGKFDVVGGRIAPGEKFDDSLRREVLEETGLNVEIGKPFFVNESRPKVRGENWQVIRIFFEAFSESSEVALSEDHDEYIWINPEEYKDYRIIDNLVPVFEAYLNR